MKRRLLRGLRLIQPAHLSHYEVKPGVVAWSDCVKIEITRGRRL